MDWLSESSFPLETLSLFVGCYGSAVTRGLERYDDIELTAYIGPRNKKSSGEQGCISV